VDQVHGAVDRGQRAQRRLAGAWRACVGAHRCSPVMEVEDELVEAVLARCSPVTEEWQRGGAPEATNCSGLSSSRGWRRARRSLEERGCGSVRAGGVSSPFYRGQGAPERGGQGGVTVALMALTPLKTGARLRGD
jgi:hypothetical protein